MRDTDKLAAGVAAADDLLGVYGITKAAGDDEDLLDDEAFVLRIKRIGRQLDLLARPRDKAAARKATKRLDVNWPKLTAAQRKEVIAQAEKDMAKGAAKYLPQVEAVFETQAPKIVANTRENMKSRIRVRVSAKTATIDEKTAATVVREDSFYVRDGAGNHRAKLSAKARKIVASGLKLGLGNDEIGEKLAETMQRLARPRSYWDMIASNFAARARNYTQMEVLEEAGIKEYRFSAVLDEATTAICRYMHGRTFSVKSAIKRIRQVQALEDPEDLDQVLGWVREGTDDDGHRHMYYERGGKKHAIARVTRPTSERDDRGGFSHGLGTPALERAGIMMPPLHANCRSVVIAI